MLSALSQYLHFGCALSPTSDVFACHRYTFKKQEPGSEKAAKRQRSSSVPDESPDGKRTRAGDSDALLKSVAQLEQSNQVRYKPQIWTTPLTAATLPVYATPTYLLAGRHRALQLADKQTIFTCYMLFDVDASFLVLHAFCLKHCLCIMSFDNSSCVL